MPARVFFVDGMFLIQPGEPPVTAIDVVASVLAFAGEASGDRMRSERSELAELVRGLPGGGPLADLLASARAVRVESRGPWEWVVSFPGDEGRRS